ALEKRSNYPSSLSETIVTNILKEKLAFEGLIFTDALEMKGVANFSEPGDIDLAALLAGNDVLLISEDVPKAVSKILEAYNNNIVTEERLAHSVKKILMAKYKVGRNNYKPVELKNLAQDLNRIKDDVLYEQLLEQAITVVKNKVGLSTVREPEAYRVAYASMGDASGDAFFKAVDKYTKVHKIEAETLNVLLPKLQADNTVVIGFHKPKA